ncbi:hypothetical protein DPMN_102969 [Dreissena polymorpha]|uniref:Uncharacterized protein n=1 Tax=Dreissena polymorpha TaxID=45954 RepID=A0A9D4H568_DREPO|nr:hypothetical protein DPMN_102969 [Dreissena polymorpha]
MDYSSGVWGYKTYSKCDTIQHRAIRAFLGVHKHASNIVINGDVGWQTITARHHIGMLRLWDRLVKMPGDRLTKRIFNWDFSQNWGWNSEIKHIFELLNLQHLFASRSMGNISLDSLLSRATDHYKKNDINKWTQGLETQPKLRTYRQIKHLYECENYVSMCLPKHLRSFNCTDQNWNLATTH